MVFPLSTTDELLQRPCRGREMPHFSKPARSGAPAGYFTPIPITSGVLLVTSGNGTFVPRIVLIRGCHARIPAPE